MRCAGDASTTGQSNLYIFEYSQKPFKTYNILFSCFIGVFANIDNDSLSFDIDGKTETELIGVAGIDIVISLLEQHYPIQV